MKILIVGGFAPSLVVFRGPLLQSLAAAGHVVAASAADNDISAAKKLAEWGVTFIPLPLQRAGLNPWRDLGYLRALRALMRREQPDVVLAYTHKPVIYSALAAAPLVPAPKVYAMITGLGFAFIGHGPKPWIARQVLQFLYRRAARHFSGMLFQNPDDHALFQQLRMAQSKTPQCIVRGSGIDLAFFNFQPYLTGSRLGNVRFLLIARLLGDKGIREYVAAARQIKRDHPAAEFHLIGPEDPNQAAIPRHEVEEWQKKGVVRYHGPLYDVRPALKECTVYVLPSYREGTPRTVLEAMATGRAVIVTDVPGCRETVFDVQGADATGVRVGRNGLLIPAKSSEALSAAMRRFIADPDLAAQMGTEGRRLAEEHYDVHCVNRQILGFMGLDRDPADGSGATVSGCRN